MAQQKRGSPVVSFHDLPSRRHVCLMAEQRGELLHVRDHDPVPYMRDVCCRDLESGRWLAHLPGCGQWPQ
jgi:hypothetical protein